MIQLACHVHASHAELADAMLCMLWDMFSGWGLTDDVTGSDPMSVTGPFQLQHYETVFSFRTGHPDFSSHVKKAVSTYLCASPMSSLPAIAHCQCLYLSGNTTVDSVTAVVVTATLPISRPFCRPVAPAACTQLEPRARADLLLPAVR